eukprot:Clim_evm70s109 gene=Clim_evmTU70s109
MAFFKRVDPAIPLGLYDQIGADGGYLRGEITTEEPVIYGEVTYQDPFYGRRPGTLEITPYRIIFAPMGMQAETKRFSIFFASIESLNAKNHKEARKSMYSWYLELRLKEALWYSFLFKPSHSQSEIMEVIGARLHPEAHGSALWAEQYALGTKEYLKSKKSGDYRSGWEPNLVDNDYTRMGLPNQRWRCSEINKDYAMIETYPEKLYVPSYVTDDQIIESAQHRNAGRLPVVAWMHPSNGTVLVRGAIPRVVGKGVRSPGDEHLVTSIRKATANSTALYVFEARQGSSSGGGSSGGLNTKEPPPPSPERGDGDEAYPGVIVRTLRLGGKIPLREAYQKLTSTLYPGLATQTFLDDLQNTGWIQHVLSTLRAVAEISKVMLERNLSAVVQDFQGTDRTVLLVSLAMILMDPHYRTIKGFKTLIEKEWIHFGYPFREHNVPPAGGRDSQEELAPTFLLFVNCLHEIMCSYQNAFEYNEDFLIELLDYFNTGLFGTFQGNDSKTVRDHLSQETLSVWPMLERDNELKNPKYLPYVSEQTLLVRARHQNIGLWKAYFMRWNKRAPTVYLQAWERDTALLYLAKLGDSNSPDAALAP